MYNYEYITIWFTGHGESQVLFEWENGIANIRAKGRYYNEM